MATVRSFGSRSYWAPKRQHDDRDFLQIDLGKDYFVEAISTRGRALRRDRDDMPIFKDVEFVKKYRIKIRTDHSDHTDAVHEEQ